ncbi:hypothetical protein PV350_31850 [Streptomyces sp. PA03-6a]|nr:hypothetical protein [Streptomyces sp. PA03-6a]
MTSTTAPAGMPARPWLSADARRWAAVRLPGWARPLWCAPVLVAAVIAAIALAADDGCTVAAPCGPMWSDAIGTVGFLVHTLWLFVLPEAAALSAPLLLLWMTRPDLWTGGAAERGVDVVVVAALCWSWAAVLARLRVRRRQRALALEAAGAVALPVPQQAEPVRRGVLRIAVGVAALVVAAVAAAIAVSGDRADRAHAAAAVRAAAVVVGNGAEDHIVVRFGDGTRHRVAVTFPEDHDRGTEVPVLVDRGWLRLAAEPYEDRTGLQLLTLTAGGLGLSLLLSGALSALRARSVRRGPVPVLRVLAGREDGRTVIRPVDDAAGAPVLAYRAVGPGAWASGEGVLFGLPAEGAELVLAAATGSGDLLVGATESPARRWVAPSSGSGSPDHAEHRREAEARVAEAAAALKPGAGPVHWHGGAGDRTAGALLLVGTVAFLGSGFSGGSWWRALLPVLGGLWLVDKALSMITWRITADATGLRVRRHLRTRLVPWAEVTRVVRTSDGELIVRRVAGLDDLRLGAVAVPGWERVRRRPSAATRAAAELTAMVRDPGLRP